MKKKKYIALLLISFLLYMLFSCQGFKNWFNGYIYLGANYYIIKPQPHLVKTKESSYSGTGMPMVPPVITEYFTNDSFIYLITSNFKHEYVYWIVNIKEKEVYVGENMKTDLYGVYNIYSNVKGPLDSLSFHNFIKERQSKFHWNKIN